MRRITVGFDGSTSARTALEWAAVETRLHDADLEVWSILDRSHAHDEPRGEDLEDDDEVAELRSAASALTAGLRAEFRTGHGAAGAQLCDASTGSDLLVVGSRGRGPLADLLLGSVSRACLQHAPTSVAVVRAFDADAEPHRRVIVGVDGSEESRHALRVAAEEARLRDAALHAIHAVHWDHLGVELMEPSTSELVSWGKTLLGAELAESHVSARSVVVNGNPTDVLVRHSTHADLLVLGSRGHSTVTTLALGSTSDHCVRHAECPVIVVRPDGTAPARSAGPGGGPD